MDYNPLLRWFLGQGIDDPVWVPTVFNKNRDQLLTTDMSRKVMAAILAHPSVKSLLSDEHFSIDGTLIKAWVSMKSFESKEGTVLHRDDHPGGPPTPAHERPFADTDTPRQPRNTEATFRREKRSNASHASVTDWPATNKGYDSVDLIDALSRMVVPPRAAQKIRRSAIDDRITHRPGYALSQRYRKKIEDPFG